MTNWEKIDRVVDLGGYAVVSHAEIPRKVMRNAGAACRFARNEGYEYVDFFDSKGDPYAVAEWDRTDEVWIYNIAE